MSIKLIAVDMDGTFLTDDKTYNRHRFQAQYEQLKQLNIHFAVASGNQLFKLMSFFDDFDHDISFVAENGAYVWTENRELNVNHLSADAVEATYRFLENYPLYRTVICGKESAYILSTVTEEGYAASLKYYSRLKTISSYNEIDDTILKVALNLQGQCQETLTSAAHRDLSGILVPVTSGHEFVDLIIPGIHKAHGMKALQKHLNIDDSEVITFGDNGNDVEMLRQSGYSFAMSNASAEAKQAARFMTGHNNGECVLDIIDLIISCVRDGSSFDEVLISRTAAFV